MSITEKISGLIQKGMRKAYSDETYVYIITSDIKSSFYNRSLKKYFPIGEAVSFLSGQTVAQNLVSRLFPVSPISEASLYPSASPSYMLGRVIDDMSDGDINPKNFGYDDFPSYVNTAKKQIGNNSAGVEKDFSLDFLLKYSLKKLEKEQKPEDNVRQEWTLFLDAMLNEYERRINHKVLTRDELKTLNDDSFSHAHNIMLISLHSETRFADISEISQLQGRIFALCDLKSELAQSICNIPKEILAEANLNIADLTKNPDLIDGNEAISSWVKEELSFAKKLYESLKQKIPKLDATAKAYLAFLMKGVEMGMKKASASF